MTFDFDQKIDRNNTNSLKYDFANERKKPLDLLPLWVADMDFQTPIEVREALIQASTHGIFGYSEVKMPYFDALYHWFDKRFNWQIKREWLVKTPGVVFALATAVKAFTEKGDAVMIQQPVYYPFSEVVEVNERRLINNALVYEAGRYRIDFEDFETSIIENQVKMFILCSPHNPVGRVWTRDELIQMGDICVKHNVLIVSDEIHCDFVYPGQTHQIFANLKPAFEDILMTCTAPSKTFNMAGLQIANNLIMNPVLKRKFKDEINRSGYSQHNTMGLVATQAAYTHGEAWLEALKVYLNDNLSFIRKFLEEKLPKIRLVEPEGTYLIWLDMKALGLSDDQINQLVIEKAKLWLDSGTMFGPDGAGFQRINIACPRALIEQAMNQLYGAFKDI